MVEFGLPPKLRRAYLDTSYEADGAVVRIGQRSTTMDALLARLGVRQGGFVSGYNPLSRPMPEGRNHRLHARLKQATRRLPRAEGHGRLGGWCEAHLLLGADPRRLAVLARRFRQRGFVVVRFGQKARLRLLATGAGG